MNLGVLMANFVPHNEYKGFITTQLSRINAKRKDYHNKSQGQLIITFIGAFLAMGLLDTIPIHSSARLFFTAAFFTPLVFSIINLLSRKYDDRLTCPHCEKDFSLTVPYICGACGSNETVSQVTALSAAVEDPKLNVDACPQCRDIPHSLMCPSCGNDIAFNLDRYNKAEKLGFGFVGTRKLKTS